MILGIVKISQIIEFYIFQKRVKKLSSYANSFKILLLSEPEVDKSFVYSKTPQRDDLLTIGVEFTFKILVVDDEMYKFQLWDFTGGERFRFLLPTYCLGANSAIIMYDVSRSQTLDNIGEWVNMIRQKSGNIPIMLVGILSDKLNEREVSTDEGKKIAKTRNLSGYIECGDQSGENLEELFETLTRLMLIDIDNRPPQKRDEDLSLNKNNLKEKKTWDSKSYFKSGSKISSTKSTSQLGGNSKLFVSAEANTDFQLKIEVQSFLEWIKDGEGLAGYINYYLQQKNTPIISELSKIYAELKQIFSEPPNLPLPPPPPIQLEAPVSSPQGKESYRDQIDNLLSKIQKFWQLQNSRIIALTLVQGRDTILYSTDNSDISVAFRNALSSWNSLNAQSIVISGVKYSVIQSTSDVLVVSSLKGKEHILIVKEKDYTLILHVEPKYSYKYWNSQLGHKSRTSGSAGANIDPQLKGEVQSFLEWVKDNEGFSLYIDYYLQQNNTPFISELSKIYAELRQIFSEPPNLPLHPPPPIQLELHREQVMKFMSIIERYWPLKTSKIISAALIKSKNSILYSTDNWEISNDLLRIMLSWDSLKPPAPVIFGVKYSIILRSPKMFIVNSSKNKRQFLIAKEGDFALILHVKPNDEFAYPYIFTHPRPPDDFEAASQVQLRTPLKEKDSESEVNCQYCGMKLTREEQSTHSCEKKPEE